MCVHTVVEASFDHGFNINTLIGVHRARNILDEKKNWQSLNPYEAVCTAGDDDVLGVPLVPLREQDALDIRLRVAGGVGARQEVALHVPQVDDGSGARRNLPLKGGENTALTPKQVL